MAFLEPSYTNEDFVRVAVGGTLASEYGESFLAPAEYADDYIREGGTIAERFTGKWFAHLSADGYMDQTAWDGPFDTLEEAREALSEEFDVDPDTGDDLDELHA